MKISFLGTGTSHGVPVIGCSCKCCTSTDTHDNRYRCSILINGNDEKQILIDAGPEFRLQAIRQKIEKIDAVLLTHGHSDHTQGIDDLRIFSSTCTHSCSQSGKNPPMHIYANTITVNDVKKRFSYIFEETQEGGGKLKCMLIPNEKFTVSNPLIIGQTALIPVPLKHGDLDVSGWLIKPIDNDGNILGNDKSIAYLTDCSYIENTSLEMVKNVKHLVIDGLRMRPHSTHCSFDEAMAYSEKIMPQHTWLTHISHESTHDEINEYLAKKYSNATAAYDGLTLSTD